LCSGVSTFTPTALSRGREDALDRPVDLVAAAGRKDADHGVFQTEPVAFRLSNFDVSRATL
jgi:hypothetical protein